MERFTWRRRRKEGLELAGLEERRRPEGVGGPPCPAT